MLDAISIIRAMLNYLTVVADILIVLLLIGWITALLKKKENFITSLVAQKSIWWSFVVAVTATLGSLFFSEVAKFEPCKLCWLQRIFMYPLAILLLQALIRKEAVIKVYALTLSLIGMIIAAYHYILQVGQMYNVNLENLSNCSTVGYSPSCSAYFFLNFGYITIPMMSLSAFTLLSLILIIGLRKKVKYFSARG